ncbi:neutral/alkaline non-lysosomal ceramidase N-terminal domain-containing protein [Mucilaginibacter mali]|uniref:Neutral/alkaline non-lysosomal ceramidase N-terminal domain-containing protein n=1 Tax=Mucilaginibacter mali TaxID=2740462 RepID=A0A7D4QFJ4_9SPHI|nr:neutral/alkaline non-lysosomal ceramidase N-terminal domain-containing protein [Mucilaginibacter mali]QKJ32644.1 neutral/alkaline non-lysosomal ceramidase N-terminal domain-containing protein [Mucilaginibacter mali]
MNDQFLAGAANVDITPPLGTYINGDFVAHYAQYIHDPLHARATVFQHREMLVAIVVVDICVMPKDFVDRVKAEINRQTGILPANMLISSTHTHAAGSVASVYLGAADLQYMHKLPGLIVKSVLLAKQNLRPAKLAWGSVDVPEHVLCRRYSMHQPYRANNPVSGNADKIKTNPFDGEDLIGEGIAKTDPQVSFLAVKGIDDEWISVVANYSLHYVGDWDNGTISADYFGEFSRQLQAKLKAGDGFVGAMSNGTSGNINIWDFLGEKDYPTGKFEKSKFIGGDIAEKVYQQLQQAEWDSNPSLSVQYTEIELKLRKPTAAELQKAEAVVMESNYEGMKIDNETLARLYAREQVLLNDLPDTLDFPVQAIRIGNGVIGGLAAEMFAETGLWLKEHSSVKDYFTIGLANGNTGYIPPQHEFENGGYETWRSRTSKLETNAEAVVKNELLSLINKLSR